MEKYQLSRRICLITGASSGIGAATAKHFVQLGALVALVDRNKEGLDATGESCPGSLILQVDLSDEEQLQTVVPRVVDHFGGLDVLVNCAGILKLDSAGDINVEAHSQVLSVNVTIAALLTKDAIPFLTKSHGCIVNVSSLAASMAYTKCLTYCASKAALEAMTRSTAAALSSAGVRVNAVAPGTIRTPLYESVFGASHADQILARAVNFQLLRRTGTPDEVASCIAFLASDAASFITGVILPVDGGGRIFNSTVPPAET